MIPERITTDRLILRRFTRRDTDAVYSAVEASLPQLSEYLPWAHAGYVREDAASYIRDSISAWKEGRAFDFAIRLRSHPSHHLGNISIWHVSRLGRTGEIGYWVRSDHAGRGIATEATAALLDKGFMHLALHKITLRIADGNRSSERVAEKLGFTQEGVLREELRINGVWVDHTLYSILEHEHGLRPAKK
ncbi:MAG: GNAT family protein [Acidimicrobiia bacterium]